VAEVEGVHGIEDEVDEVVGGDPVAEIGREQERGVAVNRNEASGDTESDTGGRCGLQGM